MRPSLHSKKTSTGIARHASVVAMAPARAVTSHLRTHYRTRYRGTYAYSRIVFAFDAFLVGVLATLLVADVALLLHGSASHGAGLDLTLVAPELRSSDVTPLEAVLRSSDGRVHEDVRLTWKLPEWVEIVHATPPLQTDGSQLFGSVTPGNDRRAQLIVRIRAAVGTPVPFNFHLRQFGLFEWRRDVWGNETREVAISSLMTGPVFPVARYAVGASVPVFVRNTGSERVSFVSVQTASASTEENESFHVDIGALNPGESRVLLIPPASSSSTDIRWNVFDEAHLTSSGRVLHDQDSMSFPVRVLETPLSDATDRTALITYQSTNPNGGFFVIHPMLKDGRAATEVPATKALGSVMIPLRDEPSRDTRWDVVPLVFDHEDIRVGVASEGVIRGAFPLRAEATYYSSSGDQLGVGPLPPRIGEPTTYWIVWTVGPANDEFRNLTFSTTLPEGVTATGKFASAIDGAFRTDGQRVTWVVPQLALSGNQEQMFAFEVRVTPMYDERNGPQYFLTTTTVTGVDAKTNIEIMSDVEGNDFQLRRK